MSAEIEEMLRRYAQHQDDLAPPVTSAEARARLELPPFSVNSAIPAASERRPGGERSYLVEPEHREEVVILTGWRAWSRRMVVALAVATLVAAGVVVVTRHSSSHQRERVPAAPAASPGTTAPATAAQAPTTTAVALPIQITPSAGLSDGQVVHVVAKGFTARTTFTVAECDASVHYGGGNLGCGYSKDVIADTTGTVSVDVPVQKVFSIGGPSIDCAVNVCIIRVFGSIPRDLMDSTPQSSWWREARGDISFAS